MHTEQVPLHENHHEEQPNISSAEQLLADISEKMEAKDFMALKDLIPDIREKISALREAQEHQPKAINIQAAIAKLNVYQEKIQAETATRH